jgi:acetyl-CoA carboxylase biotin carboxyl carrier protein
VDWELTLDRVRRAAEFCASAGLVRFRVEEGDLEIEVRRRVTVTASQPAHSEEAAPVVVPSSNGSASQTHAPSVVRAEFVGIVRLARPAVAEGTVLADDRELAYVESLGVRNPVRSNGPGRVVAVHVDDGEPVEFGQALFSIDPSS